jgi:hypothetical protein
LMIATVPQVLKLTTPTCSKLSTPPDPPGASSAAPHPPNKPTFSTASSPHRFIMSALPDSATSFWQDELIRNPPCVPRDDNVPARHISQPARHISQPARHISSSSRRLVAPQTEEAPQLQDHSGQLQQPAVRHYRSPAVRHYSQQ